MAVLTTAKKAKRKNMGRAKKDPDESSYTGRVAKRFRELREKKYPDLEAYQTALKQHGLEVPLSTLYRHEITGKIPPDHYPYYAAALGITVRVFLPTE